MNKVTTHKARRSTVGADRNPVRVTRRRAQTRARLLDAAFAVFAAKGFGQTKIEDVCDAAGYTRGAFYSNFDTLDELFYALYEQRAEVIAAQVIGALAPGASSVAELVEHVVEALMVDRDWILVKTDFLLHAARNPAVGATLRTRQMQLRDAVSDSLYGSLEKSALPTALQTPDGLWKALTAIHDGAMEHLLLDPDTEAMRRWLTELYTALLDPSG